MLPAQDLQAVHSPENRQDGVVRRRGLLKRLYPTQHNMPQYTDRRGLLEARVSTFSLSRALV